VPPAAPALARRKTTQGLGHLRGDYRRAEYIEGRSLDAAFATNLCQTRIRGPASSANGHCALSTRSLFVNRGTMILHRFIIERAIPEVGTFEREQLREAAKKSNEVLH
jgi:hypothetical protein